MESCKVLLCLQVVKLEVDSQPTHLMEFNPNSGPLLVFYLTAQTNVDSLLSTILTIYNYGVSFKNLFIGLKINFNNSTKNISVMKNIQSQYLKHSTYIKFV